ncbi:uncharacterized protein [Magallana gigas]|uniref:uncharacterized protein isoform X2 n=1 Tax=Magallana gigas TaxID=29159 RepID=UPI0033426002
MMLKWVLVILLARVTFREALASLCYSRNCSYGILDEAKPETFSCKVGFEKEFEAFKRQFGVHEKYDFSSADVFHEKPVIQSIQLHDYLKTSHPEISRYNNKDLENITHGLTLGIIIPVDRKYRALYMKFSSSSDAGNHLDNFYSRFPKKIFWEFSTSKNVSNHTHLCLQGLQPHPVSYTMLLTLYPRPLIMPQSSTYHLSFSKDNLVVAVSLYQRKNIYVFFETPHDSCVKRACLCRKAPEQTQCDEFIILSIANHTFRNKSTGIYFVKIEQYCPGDYNSDEDTIPYFARSSLIQIPGSDPVISSIIETDPSNTPFVVIGCLIALVLLIVMYLAVRNKVSMFWSFFKRKDGHITSSNQGNDTQQDTFRTSAQLCVVNSPTVDESRPLNSGRCTSSPSVYTYNSENELYDEDQASVVMDEELRNYMREVNQFQASDDGRCPVHG